MPADRIHVRVRRVTADRAALARPNLTGGELGSAVGDAIRTGLAHGPTAEADRDLAATISAAVLDQPLFLRRTRRGKGS
jgi:hypothetical protein